jgi:hypothetical protein
MEVKGRLARWAVALVASAAMIIIVALAWFLDPNQVATIVAIVALSPTLASLLWWARQGSGSPSISTPAQIDALTERLRSAIRSQWQSEAATRQLRDPEPLAVRWRPAGPPVIDHVDVSGTMYGDTNDMSGLVERFLRLPHRRLVVLGEIGSGKTTLAVLFTLELLKQGSNSDLVPVLLSAGSWNPSREHLYGWVRRRLVEDHSALRDRSAYGPTAAHDLVHSSRILPMIDGLDELPPDRRKTALTAINATFTTDNPLIITCRTDEYKITVEASRPVRGAAVIEPLPVSPSDAATFLRRGDSPSHTRRWDWLFAHLRQSRSLSAVMSSPLMIWLMRAVYAGADSNPGELLDVQQFPDPAAIEKHLLDALVPTLIGRANGQAKDADGRRTWDPNSAERWLTFIARHLQRLGTRDLAWWNLHAGSSAIVVQLVVFVVGLGFVFGIGFGLVYGVQWGFLDALIAGLSAALFAGLVLRLVPGNDLPREGRRGGWRRVLLRALAIGLTIGLTAGLVSGLGFGFTAGEHYGLLGGMEFGLEYGLVSGVVVLLLSGPVPATRLAPALRRLQSRIASRLGARFGLAVGAILLSEPVPAGRLTRATRRLRGRILRGLEGGLAAAAGVVLINAIIGGLELGPIPEFKMGLPVELGFGLMNGVGIALLVGLALSGRPARARFRLQRRWHPLFRWLAYGLAIGVGVALLLRLAFGLGSGAGYGWEFQLGAGLGLAKPPTANRSVVAGPQTYLPIGLFIGLLIGLIKWSHTSAYSDHELSPRSTLRDDRLFTIVVGLMLMPAIGLATIPSIGSLPQVGLALRFGIEFGLLFGLVRPWPHYLIARLVLALQGRLPLRLMSFLEDAHHLGILRQVGAVYQFRHARLEEHLGSSA